MERKWVIVAVGDIRGFGAWTTRAAATQEIQHPFITAFYTAMENYVRSHANAHFKYLGDGFQVIKEFESEDHKECVIRFFKELGYLLRCCNRVIKDCGDPAPDGFRMRIFSGFVYKLTVTDPHDPLRERKIPEFVGYAANAAHRILRVAPEVGCLCDGKLVSKLGDKRSIFRVRQIVSPTAYPDGVDKEDVNGLCVLKL